MVMTVKTKQSKSQGPRQHSGSSPSHAAQASLSEIKQLHLALYVQCGMKWLALFNIPIGL